MTRLELKTQAKETLRGRWGEAIAIIVVYQVIIGVMSAISQSIPFGGILQIVITVPISFGLIGQMIKFSRGEKTGVLDFFKIGFDNFSKSWSIYFNVLWKMLAPVIAYVLSIIMLVAYSIMVSMDMLDDNLLVILGIVAIVCTIISSIGLIVKSYLYQLTSYIGNDNLQMPGEEVAKKSEDIMNGHRWEYFVLNLSFIGWALLSILTLGIGLLWLIPYVQITNVKFYEYIAEINK